MPRGRGDASRGHVHGKGGGAVRPPKPSAYRPHGRSRGGGRPRGRGRCRGRSVDDHPGPSDVRLSQQRENFIETAVPNLKRKWSTFEHNNPHWFMADSIIPANNWKPLILALRESVHGMSQIPDKPTSAIDKTHTFILSRTTYGSKKEQMQCTGSVVRQQDRRLSEFAFVGVQDPIVTRDILERWAAWRPDPDQIGTWDVNDEDETPLLATRHQYAPDACITPSVHPKQRHTLPIPNRPIVLPIANGGDDAAMPSHVMLESRGDLVASLGPHNESQPIATQRAACVYSKGLSMPSSRFSSTTSEPSHNCDIPSTACCLWWGGS